MHNFSFQLHENYFLETLKILRKIRGSYRVKTQNLIIQIKGKQSCNWNVVLTQDMPLMGSTHSGAIWEAPVQNHRLYSDHSHVTKCYNIEMTNSMSQIESLVRIPWISTPFFIHIYLIYVQGVKNWVFVANSR